jgi:ATP-dependent DNA helicase RecG
MQLTPQSLISEITRIDRDQSAALKRLGITTLEDLLFHFPNRYAAFAAGGFIEASNIGDEVTLIGSLRNVEAKKSWKSKVPMTSGQFADSRGDVIQVVWMHQPYIAKMYGTGPVKIMGKLVEQKNGKLGMMNPRIEKITEMTIDHSDSLFGTNESVDHPQPVYPETRGISSNWMYHTLERIFAAGIHKQILEPIPEYLLSELKLPHIEKALLWIHRPEKSEHATASRKRFAFQEIFMVQVARQMVRNQIRTTAASSIPVTRAHTQKFWDALPFPPTGAQLRAVNGVIDDISHDEPMMRLLEGDVGSGKTAVAAAISYALADTSLSNKKPYQVAYLAPTDVLATQLFESFIEFFKNQPLPIALMTGKKVRKFPSKNDPTTWTDVSKSQLIKWMESGDIAVTIGTHALLGEKVKFKNLALAIIDEQHRFGTNQRAKITRKGAVTPHLLSMTATPIPRSLALTIYGDLDLSVLDELPPGRKVPDTRVYNFDELETIWKHLKSQLDSGRQIYLIAPRIADNEEGLDISSLDTLAAYAQKHLSGYSTATMHSKLKKDDKDATMTQFAEGTIDILISTSVIEVGVNVPNATTIVIFNADRYGLAQLHQLRGRVQRGSHQSFCFLVSKTQAENSINRLRTLASTSDGFKLAEADLENRGSGDLAGVKQWGLSDIAMEALRNPRLVEIARNSAKALLESDPDLKNHTSLSTAIHSGGYDIHFE